MGTPLFGLTPSGTWKDLLKVSNANAGIAGGNYYLVSDGSGVDSQLHLSTLGTMISGANTTLKIVGGPSQSANLLEFRNDAGFLLAYVDAAGSASFGSISNTTITPSVDNTYDLGSTSFKWKDLKLGNSIDVSTPNTFTGNYFNLAKNGTSYFSIGTSGGVTQHVSSGGLSGSTTINFNGSPYQYLNVTGNFTFTGCSNLGSGKAITVFLNGHASTVYSSTFSQSGVWKNLNALPTGIPTGTLCVLSLLSLGTTEANVVAAYKEQVF